MSLSHQVCRYVVGDVTYSVCMKCRAQVPDPDEDCPVALRRVLDRTVRHLRAKRQAENRVAASFCKCPVGNAHRMAAPSGKPPDLVPDYWCHMCNGTGYVWRFSAPDFTRASPTGEHYARTTRGPMTAMTCSVCGHLYSGPKGTSCPLSAFHEKEKEA